METSQGCKVFPLRMKSIYRLTDVCHWFVSPHYGLPLTSDPVCNPVVAWHSQAGFWPVSKEREFWPYFSSAGPGCTPRPRGYVLHDRQPHWEIEATRQQPCRNHSLAIANGSWTERFWEF